MSHNRIKAHKQNDTESSSSNSENSDNNSSTEVKHVTKNTKYKEDQKKVFKQIKKLLNVSNKKQYFTSLDLKNIKEEFAENYVPKVMAYFPASIWSYGEKSKNYHMCILRKLFKINNLEIVSKETSKKIESKTVRFYKYIIIPLLD